MVLIVYLGFVRTKRLWNPLAFYILFYGIWLTISLTNPYGLFEVSTSTYFLFWMSMVCFSIGFLIVDFPNKPVKPVHVEFSLTNRLPNSKIFLFIQLLLFTVLFYYLGKYSSMLLSMTVLDSRKIVYEAGYLFGSYTENIFFNWIITPLVHVSILLTIANFIVKNKINISLIISLTNVVLFGFIGNGRLIYFYIGLYFLIALCFRYIFVNKEKNKYFEKWEIKNSTIKNVLITAVLLFATIYIMNFVTTKRLGIVNPSLLQMYDVFVNYSLKELVVYFTGGFRAFDQFISNYSGEVFYFGRSTLAGIDELFFFLLTSVTGENSLLSNAMNEVHFNFTGGSIVIGDSQTFNAFYTSLFNFYLDFGIVGIIFIPIILGWVSGVIYRNCIRRPNIFNFVLLVYFTQNLILSEFRWNYQTPISWIIILILIIAGKKMKNNLKGKVVKHSNNNRIVESV